jgi:NADH:ubiquinone oxidoreductase subunit B-like Fe-S oxidoreductase
MCVYDCVGPPIAEALLFGVFQLQKKIRHTKVEDVV